MIRQVLSTSFAARREPVRCWGYTTGCGFIQKNRQGVCDITVMCSYDRKYEID